MNNNELDRLFGQLANRIVSVRITPGRGPLPHGVFEHDPCVLATLDDGSLVELFSFYAHERAFSPEEFVGLSVDDARRLKFSPGHSPLVDGDSPTDETAQEDRRTRPPSWTV